MQRFLHVIGTFLHQYIKYNVGETFFFWLFSKLNIAVG